MTKRTIVTLADSNYFSLLEELIHSIRKFEESENIDICVLDAGLTSNQIESINTQVNEIKKAEWDIEIPFYKKGKEWLKSQVTHVRNKLFDIEYHVFGVSGLHSFTIHIQKHIKVIVIFNFIFC